MALPSVEQLVQKIDDLINEIRASRGTGGDPAGGSRGVPMPDMSRVKAGMDKLGEEFGKLALDGAAVATVFKSITKSKDAVMSVFEDIAQRSKAPGAKVASQTISSAVQNTVAATRLGADTDTALQGEQESKNRVDYPTMLKAMKETGTGGSSFGTLTGDSLKNLNNTLEKLNLDSEKRYRGGTTDADTMAKALIISQQGSRGNLGNAGDQDRAVINAGKLADEIDKAAVATGRSREEVAGELSNRIKNNQFMLAQFGTNEEGRQSYIRSQAALSRHGQAVQDLSNDFLKFGTATEKTQGTLVALGPAGMELRAAMLQLKNATNEQERAAAEDRVRSASIKIDERQNDPRMARLAAMADAFPELKQLQGAKTMYEQNRSAAGQQYFTNQGLSPEAARAAQDAQIANRQAGKTADGRTGAQLTPGEAVTQLDMVGNRDAALGAGIAWGKLNEALKGSVGPITKITEDLSKYVPKYTPEPSPTGTSSADKNRGQYPPYQVKKDLGTLGTTGQTFEPKDIVALLHKGERVLNPKENVDLTNLFGMVSNLKSTANAGLNAQAKSENSLTSMMKDLQGTKTEEAEPEIVPEVASTTPEETGTDGITLKDVHDSLERLNTTMQIMAEHTADMKDTNRTTADMSQKMTGNRLAV
jgi:hypothetical protein